MDSLVTMVVAVIFYGIVAVIVVLAVLWEESPERRVGQRRQEFLCAVREYERDRAIAIAWVRLCHIAYERNAPLVRVNKVYQDAREGEKAYVDTHRVVGFTDQGRPILEWWRDWGISQNQDTWIPDYALVSNHGSAPRFCPGEWVAVDPDAHWSGWGPHNQHDNVLRIEGVLDAQRIDGGAADSRLHSHPVPMPAMWGLTDDLQGFLPSAGQPSALQGRAV